MTHKQKILQLLQDGDWHNHLELYRLGTVAHSRISDLRKDGWLIEMDRVDDFYRYRLVGRLEKTEATSAASVFSSGPLPPAEMACPPLSVTPGEPLTLFPPQRLEPDWS